MASFTNAEIEADLKEILMKSSGEKDNTEELNVVENDSEDIDKNNAAIDDENKKSPVKRQHDATEEIIEGKAESPTGPHGDGQLAPGETAAKTKRDEKNDKAAKLAAEKKKKLKQRGKKKRKGFGNAFVIGDEDQDEFNHRVKSTHLDALIKSTGKVSNVNLCEVGLDAQKKFLENPFAPLDPDNPGPDKLQPLIKDDIHPLKKRSMKFPKAAYFCRLCEYHCDTVAVCERHMKDKRHKKLKETGEQNRLLRNLPPLSEPHITALNQLLERIYEKLALSDADVAYRRRLVSELQKFVQTKLPVVNLAIYGSSVNGFGLKTSDINIDIEMPRGTNPAEVLTTIFSLLKQNEKYKEVRSDFTAKIPSIYFTDPVSGALGHMCIGNELSQKTTKLLGLYNQVEKRVKILGVLMRYLAQLCQMDKQQEGTLPSYSYGLMVIHFLQNTKPAVLPVLQELLPKDVTDRPKVIIEGKDCYYFDDIANLSDVWPGIGENKQSLAELWVDLLRFYSVQFNMAYHVISIRVRKTLTRDEKKWSCKKLAIEDPFITKRSVSRSVSHSKNFDYIHDCIKAACRYFGVPQTKAGPLFVRLPKVLSPEEQGHTEKTKVCAVEKETSDVRVEEENIEPSELKSEVLEEVAADSENVIEDLIEDLSSCKTTVNGSDTPTSVEAKAQDIVMDSIKEALSDIADKENLSKVVSDAFDNLVITENGIDHKDNDSIQSPTPAAALHSKFGRTDSIDRYGDDEDEEDITYIMDEVVDSEQDTPEVFVSVADSKNDDVGQGTYKEVLLANLKVDEMVFGFDKKSFTDGKMFTNGYSSIDEVHLCYGVGVFGPSPSSFSSIIHVFGQRKLVPAIICSICQKEGHLKLECPDESLPEIVELPPMNEDYKNLLDKILRQVPNDFTPSEEEINQRKEIISELEIFLREIYPECNLCMFGSSCNGFGFKNSDLDICMTLASCESAKSLNCVEIIESLAVRLKTHKGLYNILPITTAKVPIVKFKHRISQIEGDISLYNTLALYNTKMLETYSFIDERVKVLGYIMKVFAKVCDIGDASRGSLSSYAYILMVLYYLQQCKPPVIPVLQELFVEESRPKVPIEGADAWFFKDHENLSEVWSDFGTNKQTVAELWLGLLRFYTEHFNCKENVISIRQLKPLTRFEKLWNGKGIAIEDPFDLSHNLGAGLSRKMNTYIMTAYINGRALFGNCISVDKPPAGYNSFLDYFFDDNLLVEGAPPNDRGCRACGKIGHFARDCQIVIARKERRDSKEKERKDSDKKETPRKDRNDQVKGNDRRNTTRSGDRNRNRGPAMPLIPHHPNWHYGQQQFFYNSRFPVSQFPPYPYGEQNRNMNPFIQSGYNMRMQAFDPRRQGPRSSPERFTSPMQNMRQPYGGGQGRPGMINQIRGQPGRGPRSFDRSDPKKQQDTKPIKTDQKDSKKEDRTQNRGNSVSKNDKRDVGTAPTSQNNFPVSSTRSASPKWTGVSQDARISGPPAQRTQHEKSRYDYRTPNNRHSPQHTNQQNSVGPPTTSQNSPAFNQNHIRGSPGNHQHRGPIQQYNHQRDPSKLPSSGQFTKDQPKLAPNSQKESHKADLTPTRNTPIMNIYKSADLNNPRASDDLSKGPVTKLFDGSPNHKQAGHVADQSNSTHDRHNLVGPRVVNNSSNFASPNQPWHKQRALQPGQINILQRPQSAANKPDSSSQDEKNQGSRGQLFTGPISLDDDIPAAPRPIPLPQKLQFGQSFNMGPRMPLNNDSTPLIDKTCMPPPHPITSGFNQVPTGVTPQSPDHGMQHTPSPRKGDIFMARDVLGFKKRKSPPKEQPPRFQKLQAAIAKQLPHPGSPQDDLQQSSLHHPEPIPSPVQSMAANAATQFMSLSLPPGQATAQQSLLHHNVMPSFYYLQQLQEQKEQQDLMSARTADGNALSGLFGQAMLPQAQMFTMPQHQQAAQQPSQQQFDPFREQQLPVRTLDNAVNQAFTPDHKNFANQYQAPGHFQGHENHGFDQSRHGDMYFRDQQQQQQQQQPFFFGGSHQYSPQNQENFYHAQPPQTHSQTQLAPQQTQIWFSNQFPAPDESANNALQFTSYTAATPTRGQLSPNNQQPESGNGQQQQMRSPWNSLYDVPDTWLGNSQQHRFEQPYVPLLPPSSEASQLEPRPTENIDREHTAEHYHPHIAAGFGFTRGLDYQGTTNQ